MSIITEHSSKIKATLPKGDISSKMDIFYNPEMKSNRNISITLLNVLGNKDMNVALPLAGSGIRGLRFFKELKKGKIKHLFVNDVKESFFKTFNDNLELNKIKKTSKIYVHSEEASLFLMNQVNHDTGMKGFCGYFDYIDIDPFGSPNPFLAAAIARISREGILAITATDTAALTGTYPKVTKRKYWARSLKNYMMHEIGLRILIRKVQLQGMQFDKALVPVLAYHKDHYYRIYFKSLKGKEKCDALLKEHQYFVFNPKTLEYGESLCNGIKGFDTAGPLWVGDLFDHKLVAKIAKNNTFPEEQKFLDLLKEESTSDVRGYYDLHTFGKKYKLSSPKLKVALRKLKGVRTHFCKNGIKSKKSVKEVLKVLS